MFIDFITIPIQFAGYLIIGVVTQMYQKRSNTSEKTANIKLTNYNENHINKEEKMFVNSTVNIKRME